MRRAGKNLEKMRPRGKADSDRAETAPDREPTEPFAGRGSAVPPAHQPGATGRPTRKRTAEHDEATPEEAEPAEAEPGEQRGGTRAVRLTDPKRKQRA